MSGLSAAATICASIRSDVSEELAQTWHDSKLGIAHTRFLFVVLGAYQQMQLQEHPILSDVNEENFDEAFRMFRPVILGLADNSPALTDARITTMMSHFSHMFDPHIDEAHVNSVRARYGPDLIKMTSSVLGAEKIEELAGDDENARRVLKKTDGFKVFGKDLHATSMERDPIRGYVVNVRRGQLGLQAAGAPGAGS